MIVGFDDLNLTVNTDMATVVKAMASPDSGLEVRDRMWLKITIPNAFIGETVLHITVQCGTNFCWTEHEGCVLVYYFISQLKVLHFTIASVFGC